MQIFCLPGDANNVTLYQDTTNNKIKVNTPVKSDIRNWCSTLLIVKLIKSKGNW